MAGSITVSSITLDSDNNFSILSNTGAVLVSANGSGLLTGVANTSLSNKTITNPTVSGNLSFDSTGTSGIRLPSANTLTFHTSGAEDVRIDANGNVGIGTASPGATLDVTHSNGSLVRIRGVSNDGARLQFFNNAATTNGFHIGQGFSTGTDNVAYISNQANADIIFRTAATECMRIDASGRVIKPFQPAFSAYNNSSFNATSQTPLQFNIVDFNIGSNYNNSTYRFTAPIAGRYFFAVAAAFYLNGNAREINLAIRKNGTVYASGDAFIAGVQSNNTHTSAHVTVVMELAASDYVDAAWTNASASVNFYANDRRGIFSGYLLG